VGVCINPGIVACGLDNLDGVTLVRPALVAVLPSAGMIVAAHVFFACLVDVDAGRLDRVDARADATGVDGGGTDAEPPSYIGMPCGTGHCLPSDQVCCTGGFGNGNRSQGSCDTAGNCPSGDYWECMSPTDCAHAGRGPFCCGTTYSGGEFSKARCQSTCGANEATLCDPTAPTCSPPANCVPSNVFRDLFECR
jgi:hypothetical protein